ncbi:MAG TPA: rod shape-determining protein MreC [bacterium]|nr:rod shape-determining protein MreC [bacterium]
MENAGGFLSRTRNHWVLAAAVGMSLLLMALEDSTAILSVRRAIHGVIGYSVKVLDIPPRMVSARKRVVQLQKDLGEVEFERMQYEEILRENHHLRRLMGFRERTDFDLIPARVTGIGASSIRGAVFLDVGWKNGVEKNWVLITDQGVVGRVLSVSEESSMGHLLTDPNFRISVRVQRSRVMGIVRWEYGNVCVMEGVSRSSDVKAGDRIVTSGFSRIYPPGLAVGVVFEVSIDEDSLFKVIRLRTAVDFNTIEEVLIIRPGEEV